MKKNPEQTEQTRKNLRQAYWKLFAAGEKTTVDAVCRAAGYNRCTFYRYYESSSAILDEIENELCARIQLIAKAAIEESDRDFFMKEIKRLYEIEGERICILLGENGDPRFMRMMRERMAPLMLKFFELEQYPHRDLLITFFSNGLSQILSEWYRTGKNISMDELMAFASKLIYGALEGISNRK